jgi:hypothetical protein
MSHSGRDDLRRLRIVISGVAGVALIGRLIFPNLSIDAVSLGLIALGVLPWLAPLIKSAELPGGIKIEFQDVKAAAERVAAGELGAPSAPVPEPAFLAIAEQDAGLALTGLRIEIEKRLRLLAEGSGLPRSRPLARLTTDLQERGILNAEAGGGLRDLIALGNQAAHGVEVAPEAAYSAVEYGPRVLQVLDTKIEQLGLQPNRPLQPTSGARALG